MTSQRTRERLVARLREAGVADSRVLDAMLKTPRHLFVDEALASRAYEDTALPIGFGQTISQPYSVARMTEVLLAGTKLKRVLEIGTGSGYQTAILAQLVERVYTVERILGLTQKARARLRELKFTNIRFKHDDGVIGWPEHGPFDGIIVTAAPREIPESLMQQLSPEGRMVIPAGDEGKQVLHVITRTPDGFQRQELHSVQFVPFLNGVV
jgi:protein-L-isoaspartate(D-aspartate) O-methyltransferase